MIWEVWENISSKSTKLVEQISNSWVVITLMGNVIKNTYSIVFPELIWVRETDDDKTWEIVINNEKIANYLLWFAWASNSTSPEDLHRIVLKKYKDIIKEN